MRGPAPTVWKASTYSWLVLASFVGRGRSSIMHLAPPERMVIASISASSNGFTMRATRLVASVGVVGVDTPVQLDPCCVVVVALTLGVPELTATGTGMGSKYASGMATQFVDCGKVPCLISFIMEDEKLGSATPLTLAA